MIYKKKVAKVAPSLDKHGKQETYLNKNSNKTMYKSIIVFEGGSSGVYSHEGETQDYFVVGQEAEFKAEKNQYGIKLYRASKKGGYTGRPAGWVPKQVFEVQRESVSYTAGYVKDLIVAGKVNVEQFGETLQKFQAAVNDEIANIEE